MRKPEHPYDVAIERGHIRLRTIFFAKEGKTVSSLHLRGTTVDAVTEMKTSGAGVWVPKKAPSPAAETSIKWRHPDVMTAIPFPLRGTEKLVFEQAVYKYGADNQLDPYFIDYQAKIKLDGSSLGEKNVGRPEHLFDALTLDLTIQAVYCGKEILANWKHHLTEVFGATDGVIRYEEAEQYGVSGAVSRLAVAYPFLIHRLFLEFPNISVIKYSAPPYFSEGIPIKITAFRYDAEIIVGPSVVDYPEIEVLLD